MSRKKVSTTIYITPEQAERLKLLHERTKVPIAVYIREGIDLMLKAYEHMLTVQMTLEPRPVGQESPQARSEPGPSRSEGAPQPRGSRPSGAASSGYGSGGAEPAAAASDGAWVGGDTRAAEPRR